MSNSKAKKRVSRKANPFPDANTGTTNDEPQVPVKEEIMLVHPQKRDESTLSDEKENIDAPVKSTTEEQEWYPIRHPRLPIATSPRYFVNKSGVVCSNATGKLKRLKSTKNKIACYLLCVDKKKQSRFKLEEIMVYTFSEQPFDSDKHCIFHKDGDQENCAWNNLVVCDLSTLQELEIRRLEKQHPDTKYTVVRNVRDTLTFERYLVSDAGEVYSLITRKHRRPAVYEHGYQGIGLYPDTDTNQVTSSQVFIAVHSIVIQSFKGRRMEDHISGEKLNNSLKNLAFVTQSENISRAYGPVQTEARKIRKEQGNAPKKIALRPLPPVTEETKWKSVGTLPWNGRSFSRYEVSNMGHVRRRGQSKLLTLSCNLEGYTHVFMCNDKGNLKDEELSTSNVRRSTVCVSRLVANAYVDGYSDTQNVVKHLNGDRQDNRAPNLKWVSKNCGSIQRTSRKVVASLVDDPTVQKEFLSIREAQHKLSAYSFYYSFSKCNGPFTRMVNWNGQRKSALIQVF